MLAGQAPRPDRQGLPNALCPAFNTTARQLGDVRLATGGVPSSLDRLSQGWVAPRGVTLCDRHFKSMPAALPAAFLLEMRIVARGAG